MKINLVRKGFTLEAATDDDMAKILKLKKGQAYEVNFKLLRNYKLHRKFFSLINTAWEFLTEKQQEYFHNSKDGFRYTLTVAAGYYDEIYSIARREWIQVPKSIAFDKMTEDEFDKLYEAVVDLIFKLFLPQVDKEQFYNALKDY